MINYTTFTFKPKKRAENRQESKDMNDSEKLEYLIKHLEGGNMKAFSRKTGITYTTLSRIRSGEFRIASRTEKILEAYPEINRNWLLTGKGYCGDLSAKAVRDHYDRIIGEKDQIIGKLVSEIEMLRNTILALTKKD